MSEKKRGWREWLNHAFSVAPAQEPLTEEELALLDRVAKAIVKRHMEAPAILLLESVKPLNYVGSQAMAFLEPIVRGLTTGDEYTLFRQILERRQGLELLLQKIEATPRLTPESSEQSTEEAQREQVPPSNPPESDETKP
jgi:hypothetical protein